MLRQGEEDDEGVRIRQDALVELNVESRPGKTYVEFRPAKHRLFAELRGFVVASDRRRLEGHMQALTHSKSTHRASPFTS